ncbi:MAG TPA: NUDIX domain-containing protein [Allosphingosinicella sp.]|jgi:8-oxo-dGTP pyrophosphatase MutT (NUDIX family)|nr:NUDIX domain-containing protein [Allosphingosinicella sp.]
MRWLLKRLYPLQRALWRRLRPRTRGVKVMLFNARGELVLIRNSYGRSDLFLLPGGGVRPFETPEAAARREIREELGIDIEEVTLRSTHLSVSEGKRDTVFLYEAVTAQSLRPDGVEIEEARFFPPDDPPPLASPATLRRLAEYRGIAQADGRW